MRKTVPLIAFAVLLSLSGLSCGKRTHPDIPGPDTTVPPIDLAGAADYVSVDSTNVDVVGGSPFLVLELTVKTPPAGRTIVANWMENENVVKMSYPVQPDPSGKATVRIEMAAREPEFRVALALE